MADRRPFTNVDPAWAAEVRRRGVDPHALDVATEQMLAYIYGVVPFPPVTRSGRLAALSASDAVDHITSLPEDLLCNIVSLLPAKDAARTAVLSSRWRAIWRSSPLVLNDAHLLPEGHGWPPTPANSPAITAAVSHILEAHPGPFHLVFLACRCSHMSSYRHQLARWLQVLAAKGVQDLVLVNRPWPRDVPLPDALLSIATLTRLYIGASFPHLRELGICCVTMEHGILDSLVSRSPVLETLNIQGCIKGFRLCLVSQSLRCVHIHLSILERLILYGPFCSARGLCTRVRIGDSPKLHTLGFLDPGKHVLEIQNTMIMVQHPFVHIANMSDSWRYVTQCALFLTKLGKFSGWDKGEQNDRGRKREISDFKCAFWSSHPCQESAHLPQMLSQCRETPDHVKQIISIVMHASPSNFPVNSRVMWRYHQQYDYSICAVDVARDMQCLFQTDKTYPL